MTKRKKFKLTSEPLVVEQWLPAPSISVCNVTVRLGNIAEVDHQLPADSEISLIILDLQKEYFSLARKDSEPKVQGKWILRYFVGEPFPEDSTLNEIGVKHADRLIFEFAPVTKTYVPITSDPAVAIATYINEQFDKLQPTKIANLGAILVVLSGIISCGLIIKTGAKYGHSSLTLWIATLLVGVFSILYLSTFRSLSNKYFLIGITLFAPMVTLSWLGLGFPLGHPHIIAGAGILIILTLIIPLLLQQNIWVSGCGATIGLGLLIFAILHANSNLSRAQIGLIVIGLGYLILSSVVRITEYLVKLPLPSLPVGETGRVDLNPSIDAGIGLTPEGFYWEKTKTATNVTTGLVAGCCIIMAIGVTQLINSNYNWWQYTIFIALLSVALLLSTEGYIINSHTIMLVIASWLIAEIGCFGIGVANPRFAIECVVVGIIVSFIFLHGTWWLYTKSLTPFGSRLIEFIEYTIIIVLVIYGIYLTGFWDWLRNLDLYS